MRKTKKVLARRSARKAKKPRDFNQLASFGQPSRLKDEILNGLAELSVSNQPFCQPHVSLNAESGCAGLIRLHGALQKNARYPMGWPKPDIQVFVSSRPVFRDGGLYLNTHFVVYVRLESGDFVCHLSPRQTCHVVSNLSPRSKSRLREFLEVWRVCCVAIPIYRSLAETRCQLRRVSKLFQFNLGQNRVFDTSVSLVAGSDKACIGDRVAESFQSHDTPLNDMDAVVLAAKLSHAGSSTTLAQALATVTGGE